MALQTLPAPMYYPPLLGQGGPTTNSGAADAITYDSDTDRLAIVCKSTFADTIASVSFRTGTVTTGCIIQIQIESVTNGKPSGSAIAGGAVGTVTVADGDDNVWKTVTIGTPPTLAKRDKYAIVMTVDTSGATPNMQLLVANAGWSTYAGLQPTLLQDTGAGTWATPSTGSSSFEWIVTLGTAGVVPVAGLLPVNGSLVLTAISTGSASEEVANHFQVPFKCRVSGIRAFMYNFAAGADTTASLWDATGDTDAEALAQDTLDGDFAPSTTLDGYVNYIFATPVTLSINTTYYIGIKNETGNACSVAELTTATVTNAIRGFPGVGAQWYKSARNWTNTPPWTADAWTDTTTSYMQIHLIIDQLDDGASAGGGGGLRLAGHGGLAA